MAHKTRVNGTDYEISGGKTAINGTVYNIDKGKTLVNGTVHEISFYDWGDDLDTSLEFTSENQFYIIASKYWDGTMEYNNGRGWKIWDGGMVSSSINNAAGHRIYIRGTGNSRITGGSSLWSLNGTDIECNGNIETLLDYTTVKEGKHPVMAASCYWYMFKGCSELIKAPSLPATRLTNGCYQSMFKGCTKLTSAPELPATQLAVSCYYEMFMGCTSLTTAPSLPAGVLYGACYMDMFNGCMNLAVAPSLPATTLAMGCYQRMFQGCMSLTKAPSMPATQLAYYCYGGMFKKCSNLTTLPKLDAVINMAEGCYQEMFNYCSNIKLSASKTDDYVTEYKLAGSKNGFNSQKLAWGMFLNTGGTFTQLNNSGAPDANGTYYLDKSNEVI